MPRYACKSGLCAEYLDQPGYCARHAQLGATEKARRNRAYDEAKRPKELKAFYDSAAWKTARAYKLANQPTCERCGAIAEHVHHLVPVAVATYEERLDQRNLMSVCIGCHNVVEVEAQTLWGTK